MVNRTYVSHHPNDRRIFKYTAVCIPLSCTFNRYSWTKDGSPLTVNMPHGYLGPNGRVLIISATTSDEGYYQCVAQNPHGTALSNTSSVQRAYLDTGGSYRQVTTVEVQEGNAFSIRAVVSKSFPEALVHWEVVSGYSSDKSANIQSQPLETGNRVQIDQMGEKNTPNYIDTSFPCRYLQKAGFAGPLEPATLTHRREPAATVTRHAG